MYHSIKCPVCFTNLETAIPIEYCPVCKAYLEGVDVEKFNRKYYADKGTYEPKVPDQ